LQGANPCPDNLKRINMKTYKIKIQKTVQKKQYEPFTFGIEAEFEVPEGLTEDKLNDLVDKEYNYINNYTDEVIENRLDNT